MSFVDNHTYTNGIGSMDQRADTVELLNDPKLLKSCVVHVLDFQKRKYHGLRDLHDINIQQALIIKDLLFTLLGHEGQFIRMNEKYSSNDLGTNITGPEFKIAKHLNISLKLVTKKIIKYGKYYCSINSFLENYDNETFGKAVQKLCYCLTQFKDKYEKVILEIENQFKYNSNFNLTSFENILNKEVSNQMTHLYEIINVVHNETIRRHKEYYYDQNKYVDDENKMLTDLHNPESVDLFADPIKFNVCKGGLLLHVIQQRIQSYRGDVASTNFLMSLFEEVSEDYLASLNEWLSNGIINDPFNEFLIKQTTFQNFLKPLMQIYWDEIFKFRYDGLIDQFQNKEIQNKILLTGKYLNIFKHCTGIENFEAFEESLVPIKSLFSLDFELKVNHYYKRANKLLMKLIIEGYGLNSVLDYYQKMYLLSSSQVDKFIENNLNDLQRNKFKVSVSKVTKSFKSILINPQESASISKTLNSKLDFSINSLNFYELAKEVLAIEPISAEEALNDFKRGGTFDEIVNKTLSNKRQKLTSASSNPNADSADSTLNLRFDSQDISQSAILGVNVSIELPFPLNIVINYNYNLQYQLVFNNQIFIKFVDKLIDNTWREVNLSHVWNFRGFDTKIKKWTLRSRVLLNRMRDFVNELHYYISLEVINKNNTQLKQYLEKVTALLKQESLTSSFQESSDFNSSFAKGMTNAYHDLFSSKSQEAKNNSGDVIDLNNLSNQMATFLNNILRDSFLVHEKVMNDLQDLLFLIILYNQFLTKLKLSLIRTNQELFLQYQSAYPDVMGDGEVTGELVDAVYNNLNEELLKYFEGFNNLLTKFMSSISSNLDNSSQQFLNLFESLERCFPEY